MQFEKSESEGGSTCLICCQQLVGLGFLIFYIYAFAKDNAGMDVKDNLTCTDMPDVFLATFVLSGIGYLLFGYMICTGQQQEMIAASPGFGGGGTQKPPSSIYCLGCFCLLYLGTYLGIMIWAIEDYFGIDDECFDGIEIIGSETFKIACHMLGIISTIGICGFGCCCCCSCCIALLAPGMFQMQLEYADMDG